MSGNERSAGVNKQTLVVIVGAIILLGVGVFGALAFTGGDSETPTIRMPDGSTMPSDRMTGDGTHTMTDGSTMDDQEMP
jgi:hypothetical protein